MWRSEPLRLIQALRYLSIWAIVRSKCRGFKTDEINYKGKIEEKLSKMMENLQEPELFAAFSSQTFKYLTHDKILHIFIHFQKANPVKSMNDAVDHHIFSTDDFTRNVSA